MEIKKNGDRIMKEPIFFTGKYECGNSYLDKHCYCQTDPNQDYWKDKNGICMYCKGVGFRPELTSEGKAVLDFIRRYKKLIKQILESEEK